MRVTCDIDPSNPRQAALKVIAAWSAGMKLILSPRATELLLDAFTKIHEIETGTAPNDEILETRLEVTPIDQNDPMLPLVTNAAIGWHEAIERAEKAERDLAVAQRPRMIILGIDDLRIMANGQDVIRDARVHPDANVTHFLREKL